MAGRRTNIALLGLVPIAALSGGLMFLVGSDPVWPVALLHGAVGLAILLLLPWKSVIVRRGLRRSRPGRVASTVLSVAVMLALLTGVAHVLGAILGDRAVSTLALHVGAGLLALVLVVAHARRRRTRARRVDLSRRSLLNSGLLTVAAGGLGVGLQGAGALVAPAGSRRLTGSYELASGNPAGMPVTSWLFDPVPELDVRTWRLTVVSGGSSRGFTLADLGSWDDRASVVLDCTGGWWSRQEWSGVRLARLLPPGATGSVQVTSATGYLRRLPLTDELLLATSVEGLPLSTGHGAPLRLVVPGRRGYHWVKWVLRVEHDGRPWWAQPPLPLR